MSHTLTSIQIARKALIDAQQCIAADRFGCDKSERRQWDHYQNAINALNTLETRLICTQAFQPTPEEVKVLAEKAGLIEFVYPESGTFYQLTNAPEATPLFQRFASLLLDAALAGRAIEPSAHPIVMEGEDILDGTNERLLKLLASAGFDPHKVTQAGELPVFRNLLYLAETWKERREIMVSALAKGVLENLNDTCQCHDGFKSRKLRDPQCEFCNTNAEELREIASTLLADQMEEPIEPLVDPKKLYLAIQEVLANNHGPNRAGGLHRAVEELGRISRPLAEFFTQTRGRGTQ